MTLEELQETSTALWGPLWKSELQRAVGISHRGMYNWLEGKSPVPDYVADRLAPIVAERLAALTRINRKLARRAKAA